MDDHFGRALFHKMGFKEQANGQVSARGLCHQIDPVETDGFQILCE